MSRVDGSDRRRELRPIKFTRNYLSHAEGSCLVQFGGTHVLCAASVEERVPRLPQGQGPGLGHRRVRDAAALDDRARLARGVQAAAARSRSRA